ncbi:hypothetical protein E3T24_06515 [Cryobacterium sp. TmT2-59]|uniref:DUF6544 family protein n=1 Tax=Cryobacterium sp. TmT2-59 TaxID=1259264 RepID=UPI00106D135C|nr:hypothetical protein E3T24_06515 [Cryobacterium sp. TmT2-59]
MRTFMRWFVVVVLVGHGLIHLLGAAKGFDWAEVEALTQPIEPALGLVWLTAAIVVVSTGVLLAARNRMWWVAGTIGVLISQTAILTSWSDAKTGTLANLLLLATLGYTFVSHGPMSYRAEYRRHVQAALSEAQPRSGVAVTEADLAHLPELVAEHVRRSGAVGQPRVSSLRAKIHGRIRASATSRWMTYTGEQVNTYGPAPSRLFWMDATMVGLPVDVLHVLVGRTATMRVKLCSMLPMANAAGPEMDRAETVTLFNDLCILAPAALTAPGDSPPAARAVGIPLPRTTSSCTSSTTSTPSPTTPTPQRLTRRAKFYGCGGRGSRNDGLGFTRLVQSLVWPTNPPLTSVLAAGALALGARSRRLRSSHP